MVNDKRFCIAKPGALHVWLLLCFLAFPIDAQSVQVSAEIETESYENEPLKGNISITHEKGEKVETSSFSLGKKPLPVELVKEVQIAPTNPLVLSIYRFHLPAQPQGLYALPAISVRVGEKLYQSPMSSYTVQPQAASSAAKTPFTPAPPSPPASSSANTSRTASPLTGEPPSPVLRLEARVSGSDSLYPGQRTTLTYIYYFRGDIALTKEVLPLLDAEGFIKIGEKEIKDSIQGTLSISEISQQIEAVKPGTYTFGPSLIEGRAYTEDIPNHPVYAADKLSAEAPPVKVTVKPFPKENQPASFNGAVGHYTFAASLVSPSSITEGEEMSLALKISGKGNLKNVKAPDLCCQPGYSGFFRLSDLPPSEEIEGDTKTILVKLQPLNPFIEALPSVEFSFFDPDTAGYITRHSEPIPIHVAPSKNVPSANQRGTTPQKPSDKTSPPPSASPKPIEIETIFPLSKSDLYNKWFGTWWALAILPAGIGLLLYQYNLQKYLEWKKSQIPPVTSHSLFQEAFATPGKCNFTALEHSLRLALVETGLLPSADDPLPQEGLPGEVKNFWAMLEEKRFGGKEGVPLEEVRRLSEALLNKIRS